MTTKLLSTLHTVPYLLERFSLSVLISAAVGKRSKPYEAARSVDLPDKLNIGDVNEVET